MYDVVIVGAGVVGAAIARKLSQYDLSICVVEAENDVAMGATKANSAIVHGGYAESHLKLKGRLCYKGRRQFESLNQDLNFGFDPIGSLVVTDDEHDLPKLKELLENGQKNGLDDLRIVDKAELHAMEPALKENFKLALYCEGAGVCSPYEFAIALMENAIHNGCSLKLNQKLVSIEKLDQRFRLYTSSELEAPLELETKLIINCAGRFSGEVSELAGIKSVHIQPRTGEYLLFARGTGSLLNHTIFQMPSAMGKGILVSPTYHGNLLVGPDAIDADSKVTTATDTDRLLKIYSSATSVVEGIDPKQFIRSFAGIRAVDTSNDFVIGESELEGFIQCAGIQSPGLTSSPAIANLIAELVQQKLQAQLKPDFDPCRKAIIERKELLPFADIQALVELESGPERIVCRCEQVSEGTILDACSREIPINSIDAIKRRTRAGMGYCQGSFCRKRVQALLEKYFGHSFEDSFDVEHSGINRVNKQEFLEALSKS